LVFITNPEQRDITEKGFLINLIDSPGKIWNSSTYWLANFITCILY
jgi:elongation factor 2